ncbi:MBL fold metallo-hydrolase [Marihabitans asiaticum]|uniref:Glyoxylase-like metal-dependent hydrolase (Beta-lactamase superfamily II) n=1 Tax=Marihabitans asiaticum TaxID=415218 RepID=A0A560W6P2_9MICO|nr:MBL fold metallo-hydrolase [Marihabitans asiaticum]TWD13284.1 glyoxylase-like metal-dependent hydrolase (beta-lactamase superfamily II) [Marihabitans asiaticum]
MLTVTFPAAAFGTNCYVIAPGPGEECLVLDPGIGVEETLREVLTEHRLRPAAVLLSHGHVDHVYSVTPVCGGELAAYIHTDDRYRLEDPLGSSSLGEALVGMLEQQFGTQATWREPERVVEVRDGETLSVAGIDLEVLHAPGHTEGSVMFAVDAVPDGVPDEAQVDRTLLTGDVLFAGSIGRTDLPGGDHEAMLRSLRDVVAPRPDSSLVLPGHGPATTLAREKASNPYLKDVT